MSLYLHEKPGGVRNAREGQKRRAPEPCVDVRGVLGRRREDIALGAALFW
jgi:hypothetical protein